MRVTQDMSRGPEKRRESGQQMLETNFCTKNTQNFGADFLTLVLYGHGIKWSEVSQTLPCPLHTHSTPPPPTTPQSKVLRLFKNGLQNETKQSSGGQQIAVSCDKTSRKKINNSQGLAEMHIPVIGMRCQKKIRLDNRPVNR